MARLFRSIAFNVFYWTSTTLAVLAGLIVAVIPSGKPLRWVLHNWARLTVWAMRVLGGMHIEVRGREHMPVAGPALIASKHQSECDGTIMAALIPGSSTTSQPAQRIPSRAAATSSDDGPRPSSPRTTRLFGV